MNIRIAPGTARGTVAVPPSKSMAHRLLICAGMSGGESVIHGVSDCEDVQATMDCLRALGAGCRQSGDTVHVRGTDFRTARARDVLPCRESGSTLRFLIPPALLSGAPATFIGYGRLMERPMQVYAELCRERGMLFRQEGGRLTVAGGAPPSAWRAGCPQGFTGCPAMSAASLSAVCSLRCRWPQGRAKFV